MIRPNAPRRRIDLANIVRASDQQRAYREWVARAHEDMTADPRKAERLAAQQCVVCFYPQSGRIGGARHTSAQCGICQTVIHSGNTNIDVVCWGCAQSHELCRHCGADIRLRTRRQFDASAVMPALEGEGREP